MTIRTRTFVAVFGVTVVALAVAFVPLSVWLRQALMEDMEASLVAQARLATALLATRAVDDLDTEADALGALVRGRVTLVARDGRVLGDSEVPAGRVAALDNHGQREEIVQARTSGEGVALRLSRSLGIETMYGAVAAEHGDVAFVRVAVPLTRVEARLSLVSRGVLLALAAGLLLSLLLTWTVSHVLSRRIRAVADAAARYRAGDFTLPVADYGRDEIALIAGTLDRASRELGGRLAEIARERAHMEAILAGMSEGIVLIDASGRLVLTNPAVRSMLRLAEPAHGRHYLEAVRHPVVAAQLAAALAGKRPAPSEVQLDADGPRIFMANVVGVPTDRGGGAVLVLHDVTETRRADQVRRDFVANVSHELRTPLTAIRGYVEALADQPSAGDAERFLEIIARHTLRMERLVRDLLRLARLDAGQETLERANCPVAGLVASVERDMEPHLTARRQRIQADLAPDATVLRGDPAKLHDVLRNLLENASNYSPEDAVIDIATRRAPAGIVLTVADRGPGIPAVALPRVFERFYRVDRSRTRDPGGTGLGLSIVRHLVELHGGRVRAANRPGGGAVFSVWLPHGEAGAAAATPSD